MADAHSGPIKITVSDPQSGEVLAERVLENDFLLICAGDRYLKSSQRMGRTVMLAVAARKPGREDDDR
ncbi:hypothetical protein RQ831_18430 [Roseomonas gilardii]|uniref:Uncharacterized protein n=1 Tax=Roseomonas gilardii TaxID=257708 RepID=A0ABU3MJ35_9PROT|nr:hypothetical protein [Roseomonas gilardii]MDT8333034.1 hypothetical protein [Roseomonas gilardii]